jgi:hypothetical protein
LETDPPIPDSLDVDPPLMALVSSLDEGRPIDWDTAAGSADSAEQRQIVAGLKVLQDVARVFADPERAGGLLDQGAVLVGDTWGPLTVIECIGRGAFGTVYRATDTVGRPVALKILDARPGAPIGAPRIRDEGRNIAKVRHPNVVIVHGVGEFDGHVGLWTEFIDGRTLAAEVEVNGRFGGDEAAVIGRKLCGALAAVHQVGLAHGDVKAQNVMREVGGRIVLMDFGAGQSIAAPNSDRVTGTPLYLSPERLAGGPPTVAADIYALGVLLYNLVTGAYPVEGRTRDEVVRAHQEQRRTRLRDRRSDLTPLFIDVVERALNPDPKLRHRSAGAFEDALTRIAGRAGGVRGPWPATALVAATAVVAAGIVWFLAVRSSAPVSAGTATPHPAIAGAAAPLDYSVRAEFYRVTKDGHLPLQPAERVRPHDALGLDVELSRDAFVYVINEDERGLGNRLFPLPRGTLQNPLRGGQVHALPGVVDGAVRQWLVTSTGGQEHFFVVVSPTALPDVEVALDRLAAASADHPVEMPRGGDAASSLRGVAGLVEPPASPLPPPVGPWRRDARPLQSARENARGPWIRLLTLQNPVK